MPSLTFKRPVRDESLVEGHRVWKSRCGRYRVVEYRSKFGLSTVYFASTLRGDFWETIS